MGISHTVDERGIATRLLDAGAEVVICGRSEPASVPSATDGSGRAASFLAADVRDPAEVDALIDAIVERHGHLDLAVNNAGGSPNTEAATASPRFSESIVRLNLLAALHVAQRANSQMQQQEREQRDSERDRDREEHTPADICARCHGLSNAATP